MNLTDSPFASHFGTNYVLSDEEMNEMNEFISLPLKRLSVLKAEIERTQAILDSAVMEHSKILKFVEKHRALSAPARRLPPDILGEIFLRCLPTEHEAIISPTQPPLLLTEICKLWRLTALSTPRLWASMNIVVEANLRNFQARKEVTREWLRRSWKCPLSFALVLKQGFWETDAFAYVHYVIPLILFVSKRLKRLTLSGPSKYLSSFLGLIPSDTPILEFLSITELYEIGSTERHIPENLLMLPTLRQLSCSYLKKDLTRLPIQWAQLTELTIRDTRDEYGSGNFPSIQQGITILRKCNSLIKCEILFGYRDGPGAEVASNISLPFLEELGIYFRSNNNILVPRFIGSLDLPSLKVLTFGTIRQAADPTTYSVFPLVRRIGKTLKVLRIDPKLFSNRDELLECLTQCPELTSLTLSDLIVTRFESMARYRTPQSASAPNDELLSILAGNRQYGRGHLCPKLVDLDLDCHKNTFTDSCLRMLLEDQATSALSNSVAKLKSLSIRFNRSQREHMKELVERCELTGTKVTLFYKNKKSKDLDAWEGTPVSPLSPAIPLF